jgi:hypothetical protein
MSRRNRNMKKLTPSLLKKMVLQERKAMNETSDPVAAGIEDPEKVKAEEVDADKLAGSLEKDLDHLKALKIQEKKMHKQLKKIREAKRILVKRVAKRI